MSDTDDEADDNSNQKTDDGGKPALSSDLTKSYADLLRQCKGGPRRTVAVDTSKLKAAQGVRAFCAVCAANAPEVDLLLKLFGLGDDKHGNHWFSANAPHPPIPESESAAQDYLRRCLDVLNQKIEHISDDELMGMGHESMLRYGAHFSGKLIHSSADGARMPFLSRSTCQPHLSSRSLWQAGIRLPIEQADLDGTGGYKRLLRIYGDDPLVQASGLSYRVQAAIKNGIHSGLQQVRERRPSFVDHRLRQLLLPAGDGYLAVSPLPSGGLGALLSSAIECHQQLAGVTPENPDRAGVATDMQAAAQNSRAPAKPKRGRKSKAASNPDGADKPKDKSNLSDFSRISLPLGGGNSQNASIHGAKMALLFVAPQRNADLRSLWRFLHRPWTAWIANKDLEGVVKQALAMEASAALQDSSATTATRVQASGALATWVRQCHAQAVGFAEDLAQSSWDAPKGKASQEGQEGQEQEGAISLEERVTQARKSEPPLLDLCLIRQNFGAEYRSAMADHLVELLRRKTVDPASGGGLFAAGTVAHRRARAAIEQVLELAP